MERSLSKLVYEDKLKYEILNGFYSKVNQSYSNKYDLYILNDIRLLFLDLKVLFVFLLLVIRVVL